jgi:AraC-like DNA-binding protein
MDIAHALSYADSTSFLRAFKRWTSITPARFRRLVLGSERLAGE